MAHEGTRLAPMNASRSACGMFGTETTETNAAAPEETGTPSLTAVKKCSGPQMG